MHRIMKTMFRDYPAESWEYMHVRGLNAYFGYVISIMLGLLILLGI